MSSDFPALVTNGTLPDAVNQRIAAYLKLLEGKRVVVSIKEQKRTRSGNQNRYLWGVVYAAIVDEFREHGNNVDVDDIHEYCKVHVGKLKQVFVTGQGEVLTGPGSTAKLSTMEFEYYVEKVRAWAAQVLGITVPLPNE